MIGAREAAGATLDAWSSAFSSPLRAATAPGWSAPSRRSSGRSSSTGRPSTCASRSSTTPTSCASWRQRGAIFVDEETEVPEGETVVLSAHGVAPSVHANAARAGPEDDRRDLPARDQGARAGAAVRGPGLHGRPDRPRGPRGGRRDDGRGAGLDRARRSRSRTRRRSSCRRARRLAYVTQTTLSVDETSEIIATLAPAVPGRSTRRRRKTSVTRPPNRQWAVKEMLPTIDLLLVIGSRNSSNSNRLVEVARAGGVAAHLIDDERGHRRGLARRRRAARSASPPGRRRPRSSSSGCATGSARAASAIEPFAIVDEDVEFRLPVELRRELALAETQRLGRRRALDERAESSAAPRLDADQ